MDCALSHYYSLFLPHPSPFPSLSNIKAGLFFPHLGFIYLFIYWSIIALQWCVSFCFITKWISYTYMFPYLFPLASLFLTSTNKNISVWDCIFIKLTLSFFLSFNWEIIYMLYIYVKCLIFIFWGVSFSLSKKVFSFVRKCWPSWKVKGRLCPSSRHRWVPLFQSFDVLLWSRVEHFPHCSHHQH